MTAIPLATNPAGAADPLMRGPRVKGITSEFSLYLDVVRFVAACLVVIYHSNIRGIVREVLPLSDYGHSSVIVFFVLSGYVIAYVTDTKENTLRAYSASRISRIYSLALPAVLLTPLLDVIGQGLLPAIYEGKTTEGHALVRVLSSLAFTNEVWFVSIMSFSNVPYWSLCFEVWYYVLFAVFVFSPGHLRWGLSALLLLALGPKIALLFPLWLLGVLLYHWRRGYRIPETLGWTMVVVSSIALVCVDRFEVTAACTNWLKEQIGSHWHREMTFAKFFIGDYLLGGLIFVHFLGVRSVAHRLRPVLQPVSTPIRYLAGFTFSIYILHQPLILFFAALLQGDPDGYGYYLSVMAATALSIWLISLVTERRRGALRELVDRIWGRFSARAGIEARVR